MLITLTTLGLALCFQKGIIWRKALAQFKDRIVHQIIAVQPTFQAVNLSSKPLDIAGKTLTPNGTVNIPPPSVVPAVIQAPPVKSIPAAILPVAVPSPIPTVPPPAPLSLLDRSLQQKKESILKENPEYGNAVQAWEKSNVTLLKQVSNLTELRIFAFGTDKWVKYLGDIIGTVPPLPEDITEICNSNDHSKPGEKVKSTHVLVLVPEAVKVNGERFNIT